MHITLHLSEYTIGFVVEIILVIGSLCFSFLIQNYLLFCSEVLEEVRQSQELIVNQLMLKCGSKRVREFDDNSGDVCSKKKREFKAPASKDKIHKMTFKKFAEKSKKMMKWVVGMYNEWRDRLLENEYVPNQIHKANLNLFFTFSPGDLEYSLCRFAFEGRWV